jgi:hypothetical protein
MGGDGKEIWYVFYTTLIIFLKSNIGYIWPTSKKIDPIISLKKKVVGVVCQELYNNNFLMKN